MKSQDNDIFGAVVSSHLLTEEDHSFVLRYRDRLPHCGELKQKDIRKDLLICSCFVMLSAIFWANASISDWMYLGVYLFLCGILAILMTWKLRQPRLLEITKQYLKVNNDLQLLIKKCLRFIQEMEIASLGYTMTFGSSAVSRLQRIQRTKTGKFIELRYNILKACLRLTTAHRDISQTLLEFSAADVKLNAILCQIPTEELGVCFDKNSSFEDISSATDEFCLQFLRDTSVFLYLQQSEFLKLFVLSGSERTEDKIWNLIKELTNTCAIELENLSRSYETQHNFSKLSQDGEKRALTKEQIGVSDQYKAIHSIQVHLRAALDIAIKSEDDFVNAMDISDIPGILLPQLLVHLEACKGCVEEAMRCAYKEEEEGPPDERPVNHTLPPDVNDSHCDVNIDSSLLDKYDPYCEDQVFEGAMDRSEFADDRHMPYTTEEDYVKKHKEEAMYVIKELKSVLQVKTSAEEREIRKSKLFPNYTMKAVVPNNLANAAQNHPTSHERATELTFDNCLVEETGGHTHGTIADELPQNRTEIVNDRLSFQDYCASAEGGCPSTDNNAISLGLPSTLAHQVAFAALAAKAGIPKWRMSRESTFGDSDSDS